MFHVFVNLVRYRHSFHVLDDEPVFPHAISPIITSVPSPLMSSSRIITSRSSFTVLNVEIIVFF